MTMLSICGDWWALVFFVLQYEWWQWEQVHQNKEINKKEMLSATVNVNIITQHKSSTILFFVE